MFGLLHEVAAGSLDTHAHQITYAAHAHWHHFSFVQGEMTGVERDARQVKIGAVVDADDDSKEVLPARTIEYDTLVLALGSRTHFFGVPGAQDNAITLDTLEQAERLRKRLLQACVRKQALSEGGNAEPVDLAIIGAGATGVELAAELRRMETTFRQFGVLATDGSTTMRITLLEAGNRILPALPEKVSLATHTSLKNLDVSISVSDSVTRVEPQSVATKSGRVIPADITIWAAGIKAPEVLASLDGIVVNKLNQVKVSGSLQSESDENIFALGDCASCSWTSERMVPPRAQAAHK